MVQGGGIPASRRLLRRLRDVMAGAGHAQERLDEIVTIIAADMVAEVCSAYVLRAGDILELFATKGLKPEAVHKTRLRVGEGLVGDIAAHARPLALADAQSHPNFAYRPETGEEIYQSLMGVPVLRGGRVLGVLVVQNRTQRHYAEDEIETLQTVAMVLAELVASGELVDPEESRPAEGIALLPVRLDGTTLQQGVAMGRAVLHEPRIILRQMVAENAEAELNRFRRAAASMQSAIDDMLNASDLSAGGAHRDILETYRMFAEDRGWLGRIAEAIGTGLTAEAAVQKVKEDTRARMAQVLDPYIRERLLDLEDLANRLLKHLDGGADAPSDPLPEDAILVARDMGPAELLDYDRRFVRGLVLEEGGPTNHVSIVARALDIPVLGRCANALSRVESGDMLVLDADNGQLFVRPPEDIQAAFAENLRLRAARRAAFASLKDLPAITRDGVAVSLMLNAGLMVDVQYLETTGAEGIGLYRTEIPFMVRSAFPDVAAQTELYGRIMDQAGNRPVVFRTLDIGGDKVLPYWLPAEDQNPAMGWRSIRIALDRPLLLRQQLRALIRAARGRPLHVMFPMIAEVAEFERARAILEIERERARARGEDVPAHLRVGAMIEVPALIWQLDRLARRADFLSVGSNDLQQFLFASDRGNPRLAHRYDVLAPAMLSFLAELARRAAGLDLPLTVCGEMASLPIEAMTLIGLGYRALSLAPAAMGPVKMMVRSLEVSGFDRYVNNLINSGDRTLRPKLLAYARDHGVAI